MIKNPIRWVAVICVAITSVYIMYMGYRLNETLAGPDWCSRAIGADRATAGTGRVDIAASCVSLLTVQLKSIATNSHILFGVIALCLLALIVIVIAGGQLDLSTKLGSVHVGKNETPASKAATETAAAAVSKAAEITAEEPKSATLAPGEDG